MLVVSVYLYIYICYTYLHGASRYTEEATDPNPGNAASKNARRAAKA